jgi:ATP-dependent DNA helicase RecQ
MSLLLLMDAFDSGPYTSHEVAPNMTAASAKAAPDLLGTLRRYWGYDAFRPLQERIVRSLLGGHDSCVVIPTGGGKSLCYQLPAAVMSSQTVIVVSPLIALMQDQVAQLSQVGIPAALLNSALPNSEQKKIIKDAQSAKYRLLYLSPERLARADTVEWLSRVPVSLFAIDEAHCISEWGHEFRPEYRQLSKLRSHFPKCTIAAFTASATRHVRHDIIEQLKLREPHKYIASFHRPNLSYLVKECDSGSLHELLVKALRKHGGESVIVYSPTIRKVGDTVTLLKEQGIEALPYHSKLDAATRRANQEKWMSDDVRVLVGTIAFGLGINKASVRAVIHLSLPKSIEQYYQEAGRAGRDGLHSDCILFWQKQDEILLSYFIRQIEDEQERERAQQRYNAVRHFASNRLCRHLQICTHFGEIPKWKTCGACDICAGGIEWLQTPFMRETATEKMRPRARVRQQRLRDTTKIPVERIAVDPAIYEQLREWRRATASEQGLPAYVILHDLTLENICRNRPTTLSELREVSGIGEMKLERYGVQILGAIGDGQSLGDLSAQTSGNGNAAEETKRLVEQGRSFEEIARIRGLKVGTIVATAAQLIESGELSFRPEWVKEEKRTMISARCLDLGLERMRPIKDALPANITYDEIRLVVAKLRWQQRSSQGRAVLATRNAWTVKPSNQKRHSSHRSE